MNTGHHNTHGRIIYRGPRGGEYVLGAGGRKIRSFTRAPAAAAPAAPAAAATGNRNTQGRIIHRGPRGGEYVLGPGGRKIRSFTRATAAAPAPVANNVARRLAGKLRIGNNEYINKLGALYNNRGRVILGPYINENRARTRAFNQNPRFLKKWVIPYVGSNRPNQALMAKLKLKNATINHEGKNMVGQLTGVRKKIYYNKNGELYFISLNGKKHGIGNMHTQLNYRVRTPKNVRIYKRVVGFLDPLYPRAAIPPTTPVLRRSSPELLNNMITQIFVGGRGTNINAGRYTAEERNVLVRRLTNTIDQLRQLRNAKKKEAANARNALRTTGPGSASRLLKSRIAAANERTMHFNDLVRSYTRGLRAVKPVTGAVTPRARAMPNTPNRYTPAPANVTENMAYANLTRPHLVVKTPGVGVIYLSPNTFRGLVKNAARVNIAPGNVRNWLRTARRNFPNEALFRHPFAPKNVTASHIRFSRQ